MKIKKQKEIPVFAPIDLAECPNAIGTLAICQLYNVRENRNDLEQKVEAAGLDFSKFPEKRQQSAFLDALQSLEEGGILRKSEDCYESITYQICGENLQEALVAGGFPELIIGKKAAVRFYKPGRGPKAGSIESDVDEIGDSVRVLATMEQDMVRTSDVTSALKRIVQDEADSISMSRSGGVWFLAPQYIDLAKRIESFVKSLRGHNRFFWFPVAGTDEKKADIWSAFRQELRKKIRDYAGKADVVRKIMLDPEKNPKARIETIIKDLGTEEERIRSYSELLSQSSDTLLAELGREREKMLQGIAI